MALTAILHSDVTRKRSSSHQSTISLLVTSTDRRTSPENGPFSCNQHSPSRMPYPAYCRCLVSRSTISDPLILGTITTKTKICYQVFWLISEASAKHRRAYKSVLSGNGSLEMPILSRLICARSSLPHRKMELQFVTL